MTAVQRSATASGSCSLLSRHPADLAPCRRKAAQDAAIKEHGERLESLRQMAAQLASRQASGHNRLLAGCTMLGGWARLACTAVQGHEHSCMKRIPFPPPAQETVLRDQLEAVRRRHVQLCQQLLRVLRHVSTGRGWGGLAAGHAWAAAGAGMPARLSGCCQVAFTLLSLPLLLTRCPALLTTPPPSGGCVGGPVCAGGGLPRRHSQGGHAAPDGAAWGD